MLPDFTRLQVQARPSAWVRYVCLTAALLSMTTLTARAVTPNLEAGFANPPDNARPMVRWWWFGPAITKPELEHEMQQMKAGGFGGFEIQPVYPLELNDPTTGFYNLPYLSPAFLDDLQFVNTQANRLGLRVNLTLASGWPYGGPHIPVTEAASEIRLVREPVSPATSSVAVPALSHGESLLGAFLEQRNTAAGNAKPQMLTLPASGTARMQLRKDKSLNGATVLWFIASRTGQQVKRAAVGAAGFVLDPFSQHAVEDHLHQVADPLMTAFGDKPPYSVFSDSLEVSRADWTPDLLQEFRQRRGYDLLPHLPELFSASPTPEALAVRHDWGVTLTELINENYLQRISTWATTHHTLFRSQTYGSPAVSLSSNALVPLPEGEGPQWRQFSFTRWATSASHVYRRPVTSSETWTWLHSPAFRATPLDMKVEADRFFLQGVNQLMGHGWPYSPPSAGEPGWRFYAAAAFNAHNPWWIVMPDVNRYLQRVSWILRQGEPANDVAIYLPEDDAYAAFTPGKVSLSALMPHWITPALTQAIENAGYNFDYIDSAAIAARGIPYPVLILPNVDRIPLSTLKRIEQYRAAGGKVIALDRLPAHAPGLVNRTRDSELVSTLTNAMFESAKKDAVFVKNISGLEQALHRIVAPDVTFSIPEPEVGFIHRKLANVDVYFIANTGNTPVHTKVHFRSKRPFAEWLDADNGTVRAAADARNLSLDLAPYGSDILVFTNHPSTAPGSSDVSTGEGEVAKELSNGWQVHFDGSGISESMPTLSSWTDTPATVYYSGTATYRKPFELRDRLKSDVRYFLDFGNGKPLPEQVNRTHPGIRAFLDPPIRAAAVVYINGKRAGSLWHPPYRLDVTALLHPGSNVLEVKVANTAINRLSGKDLPDYRLLWARYGKRFEPQDMDHLEPVASGLMGPVELIQMRVPSR